MKIAPDVKRAGLLLAAVALCACASPQKKLVFAVIRGEDGTVKTMLDGGADPNAPDEPGSPSEDRPLASAVILKHENLVGLLLDKGANPNLGCWQGLPLTFAAWDYDAERGARITKLLLDHGAAVNLDDEILYRNLSANPDKPTGKRALDFALYPPAGYPEVVSVLVDHGALSSSFETAGDAIIYNILIRPNRDASALMSLIAEKNLAFDRKKAASLWGLANPDPQGAAAVKELLKAKDLASAKAHERLAVPEEKAGDEARQAGRLEQAMAHYRKALETSSSGSEIESRLRRKAIELASGMQPPPEVPEEAKRHLSRAKAYISSASGPDDLASAAAEFRAAAIAAPWLPQAYYNLGLIQQKTGDYAGAMASYRIYKEFGPKQDADAVRDRIDQLEVLQEKAARAR